jgi:hypothetical protein
MDTDTMYAGVQLPANIDKIKLIKDTNAKGDIHYSWEIQAMGLDVKKLQQVNSELLEIYG